VYGQEYKTVKSDDVCFSAQDSYKLVTDLEKSKSLERLTVQLEKQTEALLKQNDALKEQVKLLEEKVAAAEALAANQEKIYQANLKKQEELYKVKEKALQDDLKKASSPRWGAMFGSAGLGALITAILFLVF